MHLTALYERSTLRRCTWPRALPPYAGWLAGAVAFTVCPAFVRCCWCKHLYWAVEDVLNMRTGPLRMNIGRRRRQPSDSAFLGMLAVKVETHLREHGKC